METFLKILSHITYLSLSNLLSSLPIKIFISLIFLKERGNVDELRFKKTVSAGY